MVIGHTRRGRGPRPVAPSPSSPSPHLELKGNHECAHFFGWFFFWSLGFCGGIRGEAGEKGPPRGGLRPDGGDWPLSLKKADPRPRAPRLLGGRPVPARGVAPKKVANPRRRMLAKGCPERAASTLLENPRGETLGPGKCFFFDGPKMVFFGAGPVGVFPRPICNQGYWRVVK